MSESSDLDSIVISEHMIPTRWEKFTEVLYDEHIKHNACFGDETTKPKQIPQSFDYMDTSIRQCFDNVNGNRKKFVSAMKQRYKWSHGRAIKVFRDLSNLRQDSDDDIKTVVQTAKQDEPDDMLPLPMENSSLFQQKLKPQLIDFDGALQYFENNNPNTKEFCNAMEIRYNATIAESLETWEYIYTQKAIEYERLMRERERYQYILIQLLPHLKSLAEKQEQQQNGSVVIESTMKTGGCC